MTRIQRIYKRIRTRRVRREWLAEIDRLIENA